MRAWVPALAALVALPVTASAQLAERLAGAGTDLVRFSYPARAGVLFCQDGVRTRGQRISWRRSGADPGVCTEGEAEVEVRLADGLTRGVDLLLPGGSSEALSLGSVAADDAAAFFLEVMRDGRRQAAREAVFPLAVADLPETWRTLLGVARDPAVADPVRRQALFWVGQEAAAAAAEGLEEVARDGDEEQDVRDAAVFALSQRPPEEAVPILMELARTADQAATRARAMFWLAQHDDPRVADFFEEILLGRGM